MKHHTLAVALVRRIIRGGLFVTFLLCLPACSDRTPGPQPESARLEGGNSGPRVVALSWPAVEGARIYQVQAWDGHRLLFEEERSDTTLAVDSSMQRTLRAAQGVEYRIVAVVDGQRQRTGVQVKVVVEGENAVQ